jgi:PAS domain S-box-containing protein
MTNDDATDGLRGVAEARLRSRRATDVAGANDADQLRLVHELQVHQIELEMQNAELRQTRSELETALAAYTELYDFAPLGYLTLTSDGLIAKINLTGATLLGVERQNLLNKRFAALVAQADQERWKQHFLRVKEEGGRGMAEFALRHRDGTVFHAQLDCVRGEGSASEMRIALSDISERQRVEAERARLDQVLQDKNAELEHARFVAEKANQAKSDFLSSMSHELRTPLGAILGFAQLIESGTPLPTPSQKRSIDQILRAGWYLLELINEILDLALVESGKLSLSLEPVSLAEVMQECQTMIEPQAQKRGISVRFPQVEVAHFVQADRTRVKQVLINLLSNAIKYNKLGGTVVVDCVVPAAGRIRIRVEDSGEGLAAEKLSQLFQPFNRLGQEAQAEEGTGIGLVVSKRLVELMGGAIGVESTVGQGSVFWIELALTAAPLAASEVAASRPADPAQAPGATALRTVLYVEDNPANLMLVEDILARRPDIRLLSARDGKRGIEIARAFRPAVILMDINLPGISGLQALGILAADPGTAHIPVVALSANAIPRDIDQGLAAGFFRYLTKPIKVGEFLATLDVALEFAQTEAARSGKKDEN